MSRERGASAAYLQNKSYYEGSRTKVVSIKSIVERVGGILNGPGRERLCVRYRRDFWEKGA